MSISTATRDSVSHRKMSVSSPSSQGIDISQCLFSTHLPNIWFRHQKVSILRLKCSLNGSDVSYHSQTDVCYPCVSVSRLIIVMPFNFHYPLRMETIVPIIPNPFSFCSFCSCVFLNTPIENASVSLLQKRLWARQINQYVSRCGADSARSFDL